MNLDLNTIWFVLVGVLFTGYAILDGFDLGTGPLLLCVKEDRDRRIFLNAIGPVWNGNEVWLVTGGGALFAAFPNAYATVFSAFYDAFMLLLACLIFRAAAIEFRGQKSSPSWRRTWDFAFAASSLCSMLLLGITFGNLVQGIPLDDRHDFQGDLMSLVNPYALFSGITAVALFTMHGNIFLVLKTEGELQQRLIRWTKFTVPVYLVFFVAYHFVTFYFCPHIEDAHSRRLAILLPIGLVSLPVTLNILWQTRRGRMGWAFLSSCAALSLHMLAVGIAVFPTLVFSRPFPEHGLDIYNAASTDKSLRFMFVVAMIGVPIVLSYTATIYYVFRGKVELTDHSY